VREQVLQVAQLLPLGRFVSVQMLDQARIVEVVAPVDEPELLLTVAPADEEGGLADVDCVPELVDRQVLLPFAYRDRSFGRSGMAALEFNL